MRRGLLDALPFGLSVLALGTIFGASSGAAGINQPTASLMSVLVFSGASQFAALGLWGQGIGAVALTTLLLSSRFLLMGTAMAARLPRTSRWQRLLLGYSVCDEAYALYTSPGASGEIAYLVGVTLMLYLPWVIGTLLGVAVGPLVPVNWQQPLNSLFPMVFLVLTVLTIDSRPKAAVAVIGAVLGVAGVLWLPAGLHVPAAGLLAAALGPVLERVSGRKAVQA